MIDDEISWIRYREVELRSLAFADDAREPLGVEEIFFSIGQYPADDLGVQLGCERDDGGHVIVDEHHHTSVYNVFAAGDIVPGPQLAIRAAAGGAVAALSIHKSLVPEGRKLEPMVEAGSSR